MSLWATSRSHVGHQRFCWMRVLHSPCSWLKLSVAPVSVAGNTLIGMFTRLILRYPFHVGRAAMSSPRAERSPPLLFEQELLVHVHLKLPESPVLRRAINPRATAVRIALAHFDRHEEADQRLRLVADVHGRRNVTIFRDQLGHQHPSGVRVDPE